MQPRLVFRTHYQVDEPAYMGVLVTACTSAIRSEYPERVAERVSQTITKLGRRLNVPAGGYALDLARGLGLVSPQNNWTSLAHLVNLYFTTRHSPFDLALTEQERLVFFRCFFEGDGAALLYLSRLITEADHVPTEESDWNDLARNMFIDTYTEYLRFTSATADRVALRREVDRFRGHPYEGKTGAHKLFVHLQTMYRLGMVTGSEARGDRTYARSTPDFCLRFVDAISNAFTLEQIVREGTWADVAAAVYGLPLSDTPYDVETLMHSLTHHYRSISSTGVALCPLDALLDAIQIDGLLGSGTATRQVLLDQCLQLQRSRPREIRLHVDRAGKPAFLKLDAPFISEYDPLPER